MNPIALSAPARWTARLLTGFVGLFLVFDLAIKILHAGPAVQSAADLGWTPEAMLQLGWLELACLVLYLVPRTAPIGAILWTGYLGGAIATHVRLGNPLFSHELFPVYVAALLWLPLYLRDSRVRNLLSRPAPVVPASETPARIAGIVPA